MPGDRTKKPLHQPSSPSPRVKGPEGQPAPGSVSSAVLWFQQRAGNAATTSMIEGRAQPLFLDEQRQRISQARQFWVKLTETKPPDHGNPVQVLRQAPPEIVGVLPEGPGVDSSPESEREDSEQEQQGGTAERGGGYASEQEIESLLSGSSAEEESEDDEPSGVYLDLETAVGEGRAQVGGQGSGSGSAAPHVQPGLVGSARAQHNWAKLRSAVRKVSGGPQKVLPGREGPVKLLNFESPFQSTGSSQLKPRRNVTFGSSGFTTWNNYWLEALDQEHRPGFILAKRWEEWFQSGSQHNFWEWLADRDTEANDLLESPYSGKRVKYLDEEQQQAESDQEQGAPMSQESSSEKREYMLVPKEGMLYQDGAEFDTSSMSTVASGGGWAIYVVSTAGVWYASSHKLAKFHHSSFLAGGAVRAAGEIKVEDGRLVRITGKSGHYRPSSEHLLWAVRQLRARGVDMSAATVGDYERKPDGSLQTGLDGKPVTKWFPAEQFADVGPFAQSGPSQGPGRGGAQAPAPLQGGQGGQASNPQSKPAVATSPQERAELLARARAQGWFEKDGSWENGATGEAYVSEDELIEKMVAS